MNSPFYKMPWFWVIILVLLMVGLTLLFIFVIPSSKNRGKKVIS
jgi:hypothetical protein